MNTIIPAADQCPLETLEFRLRLTHCYPVQREDRQAVRFSHELPMHRVGHLRHVARWSYSEVIVSIIYSEAMSTTTSIFRRFVACSPGPAVPHGDPPSLGGNHYSCRKHVWH